jgi:hypothetical protein
MRKRAIVVIVLGMCLAQITPAVASEALQGLLAETLTLSCKGLRVSRHPCGNIAHTLKPTHRNDSVAARVSRVREWIFRPKIQRQAGQKIAAMQKGKRLSPKRQADLGMAYLLGNRVGEGLSALLGAYTRDPKLTVAIDAAFVGLLIYWEDLAPYQRIDWAGDLAGRLSAPWRTGQVKKPRAIDLARVIHLYLIAEEPAVAQFFLSRARAQYPHSALWQKIETLLPPAPAKQQKRKRTRKKATRSPHWLEADNPHSI